MSKTYKINLYILRTLNRKVASDILKKTNSIFIEELTSC